MQRTKQAYKPRTPSLRIENASSRPRSLVFTNKPIVVLDALNIHTLVDIAVEHLSDQIDTALAEWQVRYSQWVVENFVCDGIQVVSFVS